MKGNKIWLIASIIACHHPEPQIFILPEKERIYLTDTLPDPVISGNFSDALQPAFDSLDIRTFITHHPALRTTGTDLRKFYRSRNFAYVWHNRNGLIEQAFILYNQILRQQENGIYDSIPYTDKYISMMEDPYIGLSIERELMITAQYLNYARKVVSGLPESASRLLTWYIPRKKIDYLQLLDSLLHADGDLRKLMFPQYALLQEQLKRYHAIEKEGGWITIKADKRKYVPGDTGRVIVQLRQLLSVIGDIPTNNHSPVYDSMMVSGIRAFQRRHDLIEDGVAGPAVLREMAVPLKSRIEQILINMERARWLPRENNPEYLMVNIPAFRLLAFRNDSMFWSCKVVVGKTANQTAIFRGNLQYIVFSPYWQVPESIVQKEILPAIRRNPHYLASQNMEYYQRGKIRQRPGADNALGRVKFLFPNSFSMYLHDTPSKSLFGQQKRAFSHGCIRIEDPIWLTRYLLRNDSSWTNERIEKAMYEEKELYVKLQSPLPVYIVYFTAFVDHLGKLQFREDIYKRDPPLRERLLGKKHL